MSVPELVGGLPPPCRTAIPRVFFMLWYGIDNQISITPLDFLNNKKACKNLQNNIEEVLQIMMGHTSIKTTEIYAKLPLQYVSQNIGDRMFRAWK